MPTASPKPARGRPPKRATAALADRHPPRLIVVPMGSGSAAAVDLPVGTPHDPARVTKRAFEQAITALLDCLGSELSEPHSDPPFVEFHVPQLHRGLAVWRSVRHWEIDGFLAFMFRANRG